MSNPSQTVTRLFLIRHGESVPNVEPIIGGMIGDAGLTALGIAQAEALRDRLAATGEMHPDVLIASTLPRARQTAEILAPALGVPIVFDDDVQELRPGEADGMQVSDFKAKYGQPDFRNNPYSPLSPGGESWPQFSLRVAAALHRITTGHAGQEIVIVCHGGVIDAAFLIFCRMNTMSIPPIEFTTHNTSITQWEYHVRADFPARWRLVRYNDDRHLKGMEPKESIDWRKIPARTSEPEKHDHLSVAIPTES